MLQIWCKKKKKKGQCFTPLFITNDNTHLTVSDHINTVHYTVSSEAASKYVLIFGDVVTTLFIFGSPVVALIITIFYQYVTPN